MTTPNVLETYAEWTGEAMDADAPTWIEELSYSEIAEIEAAIDLAMAKSDNLLELSREDFFLPTLGDRLKEIEKELVDGRGFVLLRGLPRDEFDNDQMVMAYWGIGMHLGLPWPQNKHGHMLGDVTDQGKSGADNTSRGNELGGEFDFPYHSDGSDLVGLMCLQTAAEGGASTVANAVLLHNDMVRERPDLAEELYKPQPYDFRGEQAEGGKPYYQVPVFTQWEDRLFVRYIRPYILASQRHEEAPRITPLAEEAMQWMDARLGTPRYTIVMDFEPGDMQFVNNYHVLHARKAYRDDRDSGQVRHLKRLWLETRALKSRPSYFTNNVGSHWGKDKKVSRLDAAE